MTTEQRTALDHLTSLFGTVDYRVREDEKIELLGTDRLVAPDGRVETEGTDDA